MSGFGLQVGGPKNISETYRKHIGVQEVPKSPKSVPRAPQEHSKAAQERPKSTQERPESHQNVPRERPRCLPRVTFLRIFLFFNVFLRFSAFSCVFLCFVHVSLQRTPVNFSTLSSKLNCVRQQAKASKSKQSEKQAKGSQSRQEPARV